MKNAVSFLTMMLLGAMSSMAAAQTTSASTDRPKQSTILDWNAKPQPFSAKDYQELLACTLERNPEETRRFAEFHLFWRNIQTPEQNEADPNGTMAVFDGAFEGCFEFVVNEPFPFNIERLVRDWGDAYDLRVVDTGSLARCVARHAPGSAQAYIRVANDPTARPQVRTMLRVSLEVPPCMPLSRLTVDEVQLVQLLTKALREISRKARRAN